MSMEGESDRIILHVYWIKLHDFSQAYFFAYYTLSNSWIIYFSPMRCILLSDRGLFYPATYSKENAESVVGRTLESFEHSVSPLLLVVQQSERRRGETPTRAHEYAGFICMWVSLCVECAKDGFHSPCSLAAIANQLRNLGLVSDAR